MAQMLLPNKKCVEERKLFGKDGRKDYNDWIWNVFLNRKKVDSKQRKFKFHHEVLRRCGCIKGHRSHS